jgi:hypothetical protein
MLNSLYNVGGVLYNRTINKKQLMKGVSYGSRTRNK